MKFKKEIILIGNGQSVLDYRIGHYIDTFETVVRFNDYVLDEYVPCIGSKATIWSRNRGIYRFPYDNTKFDRVLLQYVKYPHHKLTDFNIETRIPWSQPISESIDTEIRQVCGEKNLENLNITTGVQTIAYLVKEFDCVVIHGFDNFIPAKRYFEPFFRERIYHSKKEWLYVHNLITNGKVIELKTIIGSIL